METVVSSETLVPISKTKQPYILEDWLAVYSQNFLSCFARNQLPVPMGIFSKE
jgi:hypothetical protein